MKLSLFKVKITAETPNGGIMLEYHNECIELEKHEAQTLLNMLEICQNIIDKKDNNNYKFNRIYERKNSYIAK